MQLCYGFVNNLLSLQNRTIMPEKYDHIIFSVTAHGLGHLTRSLLIIEKFQKLYPQNKIVVSTGIGRKTVERFLSTPFLYRQQPYEPGTIQKNCFEIDQEATVRAYRKYFKVRQRSLQNEIDFLKQNRCSGLVSDIPSLPIRAAADLDIPAVGISNFTWDWILEPIFEKRCIKVIRNNITQDYACGQLFLRLPFGQTTSPFSYSEKAPLVARKAKLRAAKVREMLGIPRWSTNGLIVVCPGGWDPHGWGVIKIRGCSSFRFLFVGNLPITCHALHAHLPHSLMKGLTFPDLVNAADVIIAKPGFGIASECLLHQTPIVFIQRPLFREAPALLADFDIAGPSSRITLHHFFAGQWEDAIVKALANKTPWKSVPENGAQLIAERLGEFFKL